MTTVTLARGLVLAALLAGAAACSRAPQGVDAIDVGDEAHGHRFDAKSGRLLYLQGDYPHKAYFCVLDPLTGAKQKAHASGYRFVDAGYAYLPESREAVLAASATSTDDSGNHVYVANIGANGSLANFTSRSGIGVPADRLVAVSLDDGGVLGEIPLARDTTVVALGRPAFSRRVFAILSGGEKTFIREYDPVKKVGKDSRVIGEFATSHAVFAETKPLVALDVKDGSSKRWLVFYDLEKEQIIAKRAEDFGLDEIVASPEATLARYSPSGDLKVAVARLDWERLSLSPVGTVRGAVDSMVFAGDRVYVAHRDPPKPGATLSIVPLSAGAGEDSVAWSGHPGRFFGYDARTKRLLFAAEGAGGVWSVSADRGALASAGAAIDHEVGRSGLKQGLFLILMIGGSTTVLALVRLAFSESSFDS